MTVRGHLALGLSVAVVVVSCQSGPDPLVVEACDTIQAAARESEAWMDGGDAPDVPAAELADRLEDRPDLSRALAEVARVIETRGDEIAAGNQGAQEDLSQAYAAVWRPCRDNGYPIPIMPDE